MPEPPAPAPEALVEPNEESTTTCPPHAASDRAENNESLITHELTPVRGAGAPYSRGFGSCASSCTARRVRVAANVHLGEYAAGLPLAASLRALHGMDAPFLDDRALVWLRRHRDLDERPAEDRGFGLARDIRDGREGASRARHVLRSDYPERAPTLPCAP